MLGWQKGDCNDGYFVNVNGTDDEYYYWNAGSALAVENISFDFRYWDTNIGGDAGGHLRCRATSATSASCSLPRSWSRKQPSRRMNCKGDAHGASPF